MLYQRKQRAPSTYGTKGKPAPKFFYLIRDDVFSSSDRSKFFDFIIPVVPVIATDNAHDLMQERFVQAGFQNVFEPKFLWAVSLYLTDLRLINNIVMENNSEYQRRKQALEDRDAKQSSRLQARLAEISRTKATSLRTKKPFK